LGSSSRRTSPLERGGGLDHPLVVEIASRLGRTPAQVLLRWSFQQGAVVIAGSSRRERIRSNAQIFEFELGSDDTAPSTRSTAPAAPHAHAETARVVARGSVRATA
jgi:diketogulonate reductase-like aldo/keto reductase